MRVLTIALFHTLALCSANIGMLHGAEAECATRLERAVRALRSSTEAPGWLRVRCVTSAVKASGGVITDTLTITGNGTFKMSTTREQQVVEDGKNVVFILRPMKKIYVGRKGPEPKKKKSVVDEFLQYVRDGHIAKCTTADTNGGLSVDVDLPPTKTKKNAITTVRIRLTRDDAVDAVTYIYAPGSDVRTASMSAISVQSLTGKDVPTDQAALHYVYSGKATLKEEFKTFLVTDISPRK
ncbi:MAG: hypothetical protein JSS89_05995 [Bacteroidetes bacterium]|nr:hypothetical protein [Bacteroidota bacterium]